MTFETYATYREIKSQTEAWRDALAVVNGTSLPDPMQYQQVIFTGCGSTYYLSIAAASLYQQLTGRSARAVPASELLLNPRTVTQVDRAAGAQEDNLRYLLIPISRSGTTTETIKAVEKFRTDYHADVYAITNYQTALADLADASIIILEGQEESVAQTRSFASMYVAVTASCARMAGRKDLLDALKNLPETGDSLMRDYESFARELGENLDFDRFYFLGSGIRYGLACEANLKMKEMTLTHSEPFHFLEFRHGPMSMVNEKAVVVGLVSDSNRSYEQALLNEMQALGGKTVALAESNGDISFGSQVPEQARGVLYLPVLQLMAFYRSLAKGLNPDRPQNLTAVVQLDM